MNRVLYRLPYKINVCCCRLPSLFLLLRLLLYYSQRFWRCCCRMRNPMFPARRPFSVRLQLTRGRVSLLWSIKEHMSLQAAIHYIQGEFQPTYRRIKAATLIICPLSSTPIYPPPPPPFPLTSTSLELTTSRLDAHHEHWLTKVQY